MFCIYVFYISLQSCQRCLLFLSLFLNVQPAVLSNPVGVVLWVSIFSLSLYTTFCWRGGIPQCLPTQLKSCNYSGNWTDPTCIVLRTIISYRNSRISIRPRGFGSLLWKSCESILSLWNQRAFHGYLNHRLPDAKIIVSCETPGKPTLMAPTDWNGLFLFFCPKNNRVHLADAVMDKSVYSKLPHVDEIRNFHAPT